MILNKTRLGLDAFDKAFGGVYFGRAALVCGAAGSGKSLLCAQFVSKVLQTGERVCVMGDRSLDEFFLNLRDLGTDPSAVMESRQLLALSCAGLGSANPSAQRADPTSPGSMAPLPFPAALNELRQLSEDENLKFFIFHCVLPWVAVLPTSELEERVGSFISLLESLDVTAILTLPEPASEAASKLRSVLTEHCAAALHISPGANGPGRTVSVTRYRGAESGAIPAKYAVEIVRGRGFVSASGQVSSGLASGAGFGGGAPSDGNRNSIGSSPRRKFHSLLSQSSPEAPQAPATPQPASLAPKPQPRPKHFRTLVQSSPQPLPEKPANVPPPALDPVEPPPPRMDPPAAAPAPNPAQGAPARHRFSAVIK